MKRILMALVAGLMLAGLTPAADGKKLVLHWHGQSFFDLETSGGTKIVFDPHAIEVFARPMLKADIICVSHFHDDHTQIQVVQNYEKAKKLIGLKGTGKKVDWNDALFKAEKIKDVSVRTVGTYHDEVQGMERGKNATFVVEADGLRIVHLGDVGHVLSKDQVDKIGPVDVLLIPVGGVYTLNGIEAKRVVEQLKPKMYIVPMHFGTKNFDEVLPVDGFLEEFKKDQIEKKTTNELVIMTDYKPKEPKVVVLHWAAKQ
ncbi:MAG: MBL fold metallo-hydrolase [Gemmataceae bacterium]|nr:MBL fold metallo-hydrolase [Gemmataceae bacterium]